MPTSATALPDTLTERIACHLGRQIIVGHYLPGQKLKELDIARELSVSSNTVRESFHIIEKRHLVVIEPRRGAFVAGITPRQVTDLYGFMFILFNELAGRAALQWQPDDLEDFVSLLARLRTHMQQNNVPDFHTAAFEFITAGLRFAKNHYLQKALTDLLPQLQRCSYVALRAETSEIAVAYTLFERIIETMMQRDSAATAVAVRAYIDNQCSIVLNAIAKPCAVAP